MKMFPAKGAASVVEASVEKNKALERCILVNVGDYDK